MPVERGKKGVGRQSPHMITIRSREELAFVLSEASALEHMIMCEYLFAAFSLKRSESEGLSAGQLKKVRSWERVITEVAIQEMTHLALVNNMLVSIGSSPYLQHLNFPQPSRYFSPNIRLALIPFGEYALRHFLYLERPEGMSIEGVPGFEVLGDLNPSELRGGLVPQEEYFSTIGNLYRGIENGFRSLVEIHGEEGTFIGSRETQATEELFGLSGLFAVRDLDSATKAVETIVEMGEGARGRWQSAHFGMFLGVFKEFMEMKRRDPDFHPARPVAAAYVRSPMGVENATLISDAFTARVADLFNACYGLVVQVLGRFFVHGEGHPQELGALVDGAVGLMAEVVKPLGIVLTSLPIGPRFPELTAGPSFELQHRELLLPHREQAFLVLRERLLELRSYTVALSRDAPSRALSNELKRIGRRLQEVADSLQLEAHDTSPLGSRSPG